MNNNEFSKRFLNLEKQISDDSLLNSLSIEELNNLLLEAKEAEKE